MATKLKIRKGDKVQVIAGRDKGKQGEVTKVLPTEGKVVVAGINVAKRHTRPTQMSAGGIINKELPIDISNVAHLDPKDGKPTKVGCQIQKDGTKVRIAKRSGEVISQ